MPFADIFSEIFHHALDHPTAGGGSLFGFTRFSATVVLAAILLVVLLVIARKDTPLPTGRLRNVFESLVLFIRDQLVYPTMGEHLGARFLPFFLTLFTFIFTVNLLGMVPIPSAAAGGTATANIGVTGGLAVVILGVSIIAGMVVQGPAHFVKSFIPPGVPRALSPLLLALELVGFFIKHGVLAIRLFANMLAGHLVIGAFIGLIIVARSWILPPLPLAMALFVSLIELLVCFLQAYVFTLLSVLFIGNAVHPEH